MKTLTMSSDRSVLGDDEIEEILLRLPAIDLVCYKAVCKGWRSLISSAEFVSAHLKRSKSNPFLLVHTDPNRAAEGIFQPTASYASQCIDMVGSVNGLICTVGNPLTLSHSGIFIWNPITGLSTELPPPSTPSTSKRGNIIKFAFWCDDSDGGGGVYKVAKLFREHYSSPMMVEVWVSSFPHTWTTVTTADLDLYCFGWVSGPQVLIEGLTAYWIVTNVNDVTFVMLLDLKTFSLEAIPLSEVEACLPALHFGPYLLSAANFKGDFVLVQRSFSDDGVYDIWTMGMDAPRGWKKSSTFRLGYTFFRCLGSVNGKLLVLQRCANGITLYDMETGMHDVLGEDSDPSLRSSAHGFVGSLVSIEGFETSDLYADISWPNSFATGRILKMQMQSSPPPFMYPPWGKIQIHMPPPPH